MTHKWSERGERPQGREIERVKQKQTKQTTTTTKGGREGGGGEERMKKKKKKNRADFTDVNKPAQGYIQIGK